MTATRAVACAAAFCWCAATAHAADAPDFKATAHTIAIASILGDTVQAPDGKPIATPDAGFDDVAEHAIVTQIAADLPGVAVVRVGGPHDTLVQQMYPRAGFGDLGLKNVQRALRDWTAVHAADYIVIVRKTVGVAGYGGMHWTIFGIGVSGNTYAFLNITVLDGKTLDVVTDMSVRDMDWGSMRYDSRLGPTPEQLLILVDDVRAMLTSVVPGLVHGVGL